LVEALKSRDADIIERAFQKGATSSYEAFLGDNTGERNAAQVFGLIGSE